MRALFQSAEILVVDKPSGLAVHRGLSRDGDSLVDRLRDSGFGDTYTVHRLDRPTSGVLLLARNSSMARFLSQRFEAHEVEKTYWALVRGAPLSRDTVVDQPVPKDEGAERVPARTRVRTLATAVIDGSPLREKRVSLLEAKPETGRFHQIRRHTKHIGCPILGDTTYGKSEHNRLARERFGLARLALHARRLRVELPSGEILDVESPLPDDMAAMMRALGMAAPE
ncbi:MAG: RluA family pseudouridine synthase [Myxococcales bacterium]|nr:RluA family pseudouridine synthase [Myxococcales bacterium]